MLFTCKISMTCFARHVIRGNYITSSGLRGNSNYVRGGDEKEGDDTHAPQKRNFAWRGARAELARAQLMLIKNDK